MSPEPQPGEGFPSATPADQIPAHLSPETPSPEVFELPQFTLDVVIVEDEQDIANLAQLLFLAAQNRGYDPTAIEPYKSWLETHSLNRPALLSTLAHLVEQLAADIPQLHPEVTTHIATDLRSAHTLLTEVLPQQPQDTPRVKVVLLDIQLQEQTHTQGKMDAGLSLLDRIRSDNPQLNYQRFDLPRNTQVIIITGLDTNEVRSTLIKAGHGEDIGHITHIVAKPFDAHRFQDTIQKAITCAVFDALLEPPSSLSPPDTTPQPEQLPPEITHLIQAIDEIGIYPTSESLSTVFALRKQVRLILENAESPYLHPTLEGPEKQLFMILDQALKRSDTPQQVRSAILDYLTLRLEESPTDTALDDSLYGLASYISTPEDIRHLAATIVQHWPESGWELFRNIGWYFLQQTSGQSNSNITRLRQTMFRALMLYANDQKFKTEALAEEIGHILHNATARDVPQIHQSAIELDLEPNFVQQLTHRLSVKGVVRLNQ